MAAERRVGVTPDLADAFVRFAPAVADAWASSCLAGVPARLGRLLLAEAREAHVAAGELFYRGAAHDELPMCALVASGQLRIYRQTDTGRQVTMMYHFAGALAGIPSLLSRGARRDAEAARELWVMLGGRRVYAEALQDSLLLRFSASQFLHLAQTEAALAWPLATYLARNEAITEHMLTDDMFLSVRARVARHLIDLAVLDDGELAVCLGHQEIADAIGSVREVATRAMLDMRRAGLLTRKGHKTVLADVEQLRLIASVH
jgi:CRP-like cAMP-binding protein